MSPRSCGDCTLCCKLLSITELEKPIGKWCPHCEIGKGCKIYDCRPQSCREFTCLWLDQEEWKPEDRWPVEARPDRCGVVLFTLPDQPQWVYAKCDPNRPQAWQRGMGHELIQVCLNTGHDVLLSIGKKQKYLTLNEDTAKDILNEIRAAGKVPRERRKEHRP